MEIKFSRHAKRRARLYRISESAIMELLKGKELTLGINEIIENIEGFKHPIKIVIALEGDTLTVITNYPLKKGGKR